MKVKGKCNGRKMIAESDGMIEKWRHKVMSILKSSAIKCRQFWEKDIFVRF